MFTHAHRLHALFGQRPLLCDGAMGTMLYERGVYINRCYDELNLSEPDLVRGVHADYLLAGAVLLETNTFGANRLRLQRFGLADKLEAINHAGVRLAREAAAQMTGHHAADVWVAGSMGTLGVSMTGEGAVPADAVREAYAEQVRALASAGANGSGVDLLIAETLSSLAEAEQALAAARENAPGLPIVVMLNVTDDGMCLDGTHPELAASRLTAWGADGVGANCSTGPAAVLRAVESMAAGTHLPLFAMPNAGVPRAIDGRTLYLSSPEYMASFARKFLRAGAQFVGGCCGTTPAHIRAMRSFLRAQSAQAAAAVEAPSRSGPDSDATPPPPLAARSRIGERIARGAFVRLVEVLPPRGIDAARELEGARLLAEHGIDAINVPDSPRASPRMSAQSLCLQIQQHTGLETVLHYTCRDRNLLGIQSELLGAASLGLKNMLCLTGDPPRLGAYPDATAVFDVDAIGLVRIVRGLNHGFDISGAPLGVSTGFTVAAAANPGVPDLDNEVRRFALKVEAGAEYAITQPVFDLRLLEQFLRRIEQFRIPVVAGIWPLTSLRNAEFMRNDLKVAVPDEIMARMARAGSPEAAREEGIRIAQQMLEQARPSVQGVAASAPFGRYQTALDTLAAVLPERAAAPAS